MYNTGLNLNTGIAAGGGVSAATWMGYVSPVLFSLLVAIAFCGLVFIVCSHITAKKNNAELS